jgi:hypothetical protein
MPVVQGKVVGFISFPSAHFEVDPTGGALVVSDGQVNPIRRTTAQPYLQGAGRFWGREVSYDQATKRWLPVPREFVSPDGLRYVYITTIGPPNTPAGSPYVSKAHIVDAASGAERTHDLPGIPVIGVVVDFAANGVYITSGWEGLPNGLWRLNPDDGSFGKLTDKPGVVAIQDGVLWTFYLKNVEARYPTGYPVDTVRRIDLSGGGAADWFSPGVPIHPFGLDGQGRPLIAAYPYLRADGRDYAADVWQISAPGQARKILSHWSGAQSLSDSHGIWLGTERGLYLYDEATGLRKVAIDAVVALGPCV